MGKVRLGGCRNICLELCRKRDIRCDRLKLRETVLTVGYRGVLGLTHAGSGNNLLGTAKAFVLANVASQTPVTNKRQRYMMFFLFDQNP
jgi:hypothetical protein